MTSGFIFSPSMKNEKTEAILAYKSRTSSGRKKGCRKRELYLLLGLFSTC
jgi:hypothetical protein